MRTDLDPDDVGPRQFYKLLTSVVVPRPIAWVSSRSATGVDNLAPHSFFTVSCVNPPMVQFTSVGTKDSLRNVRETGEFVVCLPSRRCSSSERDEHRRSPPGERVQRGRADPRAEPAGRAAASRSLRRRWSAGCTMRSSSATPRW